MPFDLQTIIAVIFFILLSVYVHKHRKKLDVHGKFPFFYFSMYKTKMGLGFMDTCAKKFNKTFKWLGYIGIVVGFLGMILICFALLQNIYNMATKPEAIAGVGLVLPFKVKGVFYVPFLYWLISIFFVAFIHELAHGVIARVHGLKVKSSGLAFAGTSYLIAGIVVLGFSGYSRLKEANFDTMSIISTFNPLMHSGDFWLSVAFVFIAIGLIRNVPFPVIPAAFVEPDEKVLPKQPHRVQQSVFAAGPFSNVLLALIVLALMFPTTSLVAGMFEPTGVEITGFLEGDFPAEKSGIVEGEIVKGINDLPVESLANFSGILRDTKPGDIIHLQTDKDRYSIKLSENPDNESMSYLGVYVQQDVDVTEPYKSALGKAFAHSMMWLLGLFKWLFILNLGIGLFNLVPIGPLDGGRMLQLVTTRYFGKEKGLKIWYYISMLFLTLVLINIIYAFF